MGVGAGRLQAGSLRHTRPRVTGPGLGSLSPPVFFSRYKSKPTLSQRQYLTSRERERLSHAGLIPLPTPSQPSPFHNNPVSCKLLASFTGEAQCLVLLGSNWLNWDLSPRGLIPEPTLSRLCALVSSCLLEVLFHPLFPLILQIPGWQGLLLAPLGGEHTEWLVHISWVSQLASG